MKAKHQAALIASIVLGVENVSDLAVALSKADINDGDITGEHSEKLVGVARDILLAEDLSSVSSAAAAFDHTSEMRSMIASLVNACGVVPTGHLYGIAEEVIETLSTDLVWPEWMARFDVTSGLMSDVSEKFSKEAGITLNIHGVFDDGLIVSFFTIWPKEVGPKHAWPFDHGQNPFSAE